MYKHVLLPTDGSALSDIAVESGIAFAKSIGARLTGCYVVLERQPDSFEDYAPVNVKAPDPADSAAREAKQYLSAIERNEVELEKILSAESTLDITGKTVELRSRGQTEATTAKGLAEAQGVRSGIQKQRYTDWIAAGASASEKQQIEAINSALAYRNISVAIGTGRLLNRPTISHTGNSARMPARSAAGRTNSNSRASRTSPAFKCSWMRCSNVLVSNSWSVTTGGAG